MRRWTKNNNNIMIFGLYIIMRSRAALLACISCLSLAIHTLCCLWLTDVDVDDVKRRKARRRVVKSLY